jgi:hypothetical protein
MAEHRPFLSTKGLSGDRVPLAYRVPGVNPASLGPLDSRIEDVSSALPRFLTLLHRCLGMPDVDSVIDVCLEELGLSSDQCNAASLLAALYRSLLQEDDAEGYVVTTALFARLQDPKLAELPARAFLAETARRYAEHTSHLFPLLHQHASATLTLCELANRSRIRLLMRDALIFWPSLLALRPRILEIPLDFLVFTRPLKESGRDPLVFSENGDAVLTRSVLETPARTLVLDVGLYGTLVRDLDDRGFFGGDGSVFFLGSRNPHIAGFLNELRSAEAPATALFPQRDVVRYVDTVECLLKPFLFLSCPDSDRIFIEMNDGISFVCSVVFLWSLYRYSQEASHTERLRPRTGALWSNGGLERRWLLSEPIPSWSKAEGFVAAWSARDLTSAADARCWLDRWRKDEESC